MGKSLRLGIGKRWTSGSEVPVGDREEQAEATSRSQQRSETAYQSRLSIQHCPSQGSPGQRHAQVVDAAGEELESIGSSRVTDQEQGIGRTTGTDAASGAP